MQPLRRKSLAVFSALNVKTFFDVVHLTENYKTLYNLKLK